MQFHTPLESVHPEGSPAQALMGAPWGSGRRPGRT